MNNKTAWIGDPAKAFPNPSNLVDVIKWHIALQDRAEELYRQANEKAYQTTCPCLSDFRSCPEHDVLIKRDRDYISGLGYEMVAQIETAMLIGRELFYKERNGHSVYDPQLSKIDIRSLKEWAIIFEVPLTEKTGGKIDSAVSYALGKNKEFLQAYIDRLIEE